MRKIERKIKNESERKRYARKLVIRKLVNGTTDKPRISFSKTNKHLLVQVIDDSKSITLLTVSTYNEKETNKSFSNIASAVNLAKKTAEELTKKNLKTVVFDRSGYKFTGIVTKYVETLREQGILV